MKSFSQVFLLAFIVVWACGCGDDDGSKKAPLNPNPSLTIGAAQGRPARVVLPDDYNIEVEYPLVILLHGYGANSQLQDFIFGLAPRTTRFQFIAVFPEGTVSPTGQQFWDGTPQCCNFTGTPVDDVGYLASLMEEAMDVYAVDPDRIRLVGHSNGGYMAYRYMCEHPVDIDRVAVLAGSTFLDAESCVDPQPIDVLHMHGTLDSTIPYLANLPPDDNLRGADTIGAEATVERWAQLSRCSAGFELIERRDYHVTIRIGDDPAETEILRAQGCPGDRSIELWRGVNADHLYVTGNNAWRDAVATFLSE